MNNKKIIGLATLAMSLSSFSYSAELGVFGDTTFSVGGYIKAEGVINRPDSDAAFGASNTFEGSVRQSRLNFKADREIEGHKVQGVVEGDFYGGFYSSSSADWRLRHAYISVDSFTVGQTWNGQFFAIAPFDGEMINFWGLGAGTIAGNGGKVRPDMVLHYASNGFRASFQDPIYVDADIPDMVFSYTNLFKNGGYNIALTGREVQNGADSDFGLGVSVAGKYVFEGGHDFRASVFTGEGMGVYSGVGVGGAYSSANVTTLDAENGELTSQYGFSLAYKYQFSKKLRATIRHGEVHVDDVADTDLKMSNINFIYSYLPQLDLGIEWRDQNIDTLNGPSTSAFPNIRPKGQQLELMAMYRF
jgi:hypothetical protein